MLACSNILFDFVLVIILPFPLSTPLILLSPHPPPFGNRYQSRKRGILEMDLLLSTFAAKQLPLFTKAELQAYDTLLDENDWDIYYWITEEQPIPEDVKDNPIIPMLKEHLKNDQKLIRRMPDLIKAAEKAATAPQSVADEPAAQATESTSLYVGNMPYTARWQDLKDLFQESGMYHVVDPSF